MKKFNLIIPALALLIALSCLVSCVPASDARGGSASLSGGTASVPSVSTGVLTTPVTSLAPETVPATSAYLPVSEVQTSAPTAPSSTLAPVTYPPVTVPEDPKPPKPGTTAPDETEAPQTGLIAVKTDPLYSDFKFTAPRAALYDMTADLLLLAKGMYDKMYPASTTKVLTALYARTIIGLDEVITVGDELDRVADDASVAEIKTGEKYTFEQLLFGMMLVSGNDSAYTVAAHCGRVLAGDMSIPTSEALDIFMGGLNRFAASLGMNGTHFTVPDGYPDDDHYTTLHDMLVMTKKALADPELIRITSTAVCVFTTAGGRLCMYKNTNLLLDSEGEYYYPNVIGLKTGTTNAAGNCLISLCRRSDGHIIASLVYGVKRSKGRYEESIKLLDYAGCRELSE